MAPHSSTLAWKIPWTEESGRLQSMGSLRVGHDWGLHFHFSLSCIGEGNGNPLQCSCLENPRDGGAWWAAVYGVAQSRTRPKWLSSSSNSLRPPWQSYFLLCPLLLKLKVSIWSSFGQWYLTRSLSRGWRVGVGKSCVPDKIGTHTGGPRLPSWLYLECRCDIWCWCSRLAIMRWQA